MLKKPMSITDFYTCTYQPSYEPDKGKVCITSCITQWPLIYRYTRQQLQKLLARNDYFKPVYQMALDEFPKERTDGKV